MAEVLTSLAVVAVVVLLPLVPATLLFRQIPLARQAPSASHDSASNSRSQGQVSGTFKGMVYKFGGAAAGYFAIFIPLIAIAQPELARQTELLKQIDRDIAQADRFETIQLRGNVVLSPEEPGHFPTDVRVRLVPPMVQIMPGGGFAFDIPVKNHGGHRTFPTVLFDHDGYASIPLCLMYRVQCERGNQWIDQEVIDESNIQLKAPIVLSSLPRYAGGQPAPESLAPKPPTS